MTLHLFIGQLPRVSGKDPERKEWTQLLKRVFFIYSLFVCKQIFSFSLFQPSLFIQYSTEECSSVQYKAAGPVRAVISIRYGSKEGVQGSCWSPNIFGHKMVISERILMFHVSIEPY